LKTILNLPTETLGETLEQELKQISPDSHRLIILPFLSGERSLGWHDNARGAIIGLQLTTKPIEILRAGLEAIAYQFLLIYEEMVKALGIPDKIIATGGGLYNSEVWGEIIADVLGQPLYVSHHSEASSRGTALLVLENLNLLKLLPNNNFEKIYLPKLENKEVYQKAFRRYQLCYEKLVADNMA
ncbi:MAG: gluconokinase, partial [bacterium]